MTEVRAIRSESVKREWNEEVEQRFGLMPNFFRLGGENPEITASFWGFARFAYLDNPLPSLFKEKLFVFLSRFCEARYCITRHIGFLVGLGHASGDSRSPVQSIEQVIELLRRPLPRRDALDPLIAKLNSTGVVSPDALENDPDLCEAVFTVSTHIFLQTPDASRALDAIKRVFEEKHFQYLLVFLAFVRTAHYWTKIQTDLHFEDDIKQLLATHKMLAELLENDPETATLMTSPVLVNELASLRSEKGKAEEATQVHRMLQKRNDSLQGDLMDRLNELQKANQESAASRRAALNVMEDAIASREALRKIEERQAFLLKLGDELRSLTDPQTIMGASCQALGRQLQVSTVLYSLVNADEDSAEIAAVYSDGSIPGMMPGHRFLLSEQGAGWQSALRAGEEVFSANNRSDPRGLSVPGFSSFGELAGAAVPLKKNGRLVAWLSAGNVHVREWSEADRKLLREVAERTWAAVERAHSEEALRKNEERLRALFNSMNEAFVVIESVNDKDGKTSDYRFVEYNPAFSRHSGLEDPRGRTINELITTNEPELLDQFGRVLSTGEPAHFEVHLSALRRWWAISASRLNGSDSGRLAIVFSDVTTRKEADQALKVSEERFRTLTNAVPQVIWANDGKGVANYFNQRWYDYSGLSFDESVGVGWEAIVHPDDKPASVKEWQGALEKGELFDTEYRLRRRDGVYRWHIGRNVPLKNESGTVVGWFGSATDIESLKEAEENLRSTTERLQMALEAGRLGSYEYDFQTGRITATAQQKAHLGYSEEADINVKELKELIFPEDHEPMVTAYMDALKGKKNYFTEYRIRSKDGEVRWLKSVGRVIHDEKNEPQKMVGITLDITEQKLFTEALSKQVKERTIALEQSNEDLLQFAHVASHDLKEPVRKIKTFNGRLISEYGHLLPEKGKIYLERIQAGTNRMFLMIEGVLNYSTIGNAEGSFEKVDLGETVKQIESDLELLIRSKKAAISFSGLPVVMANTWLMYQLFYNLILNSLKFAKASVPARIDIKGEILTKEQKKFARISLSDNGIGFEEEFNKKIFETFTRLNGTDEYEGTGLGLALCKKIVERHQGEISASGVPDEGAVFTILLPC